VPRRVALIGVPTSAGAFAPGQEQAPAALREASLVERLEGAGVEVVDRGDREVWRWRPDREQTRAQNLGKVVEIARETAARVERGLGDADVALVLGGDCTVGIGTVAGVVAGGERVGLLYFDTHADLNVPDAVPEGALDWMGVAHMLGEPDARPELADAFGPAPLLEPEQVLLFAWGPEQATEHELAAVSRTGVETIEVGPVREDPEAAAARALESIEGRCDRLLVHFDVDVVDFTDTPLSENWGRNEGLPFEAALAALEVLLSSPRLRALTITELNPDHTEEGGGAVERLAEGISVGLGGKRGRKPHA
jgi:arginase